MRMRRANLSRFALFNTTKFPFNFIRNENQFFFFFSFFLFIYLFIYFCSYTLISHE